MPYQEESQAWWHISDDERRQQQTASNFRIYPSEDFDVVLMPFEIGIRSAYGPELLRRMFGAQLSVLLQLRSVDYALKNYVPSDFPNAVERDRGDEELTHTCIKIVEDMLDNIRNHNKSNPETTPLGRVIGDATLARVPFSLRQAFTMANRGALFECLCIVRMVMEQCAWCFKITDFTDSEGPEKIQGNKVIGVLNTAHSNAGRFYGWLSSHAHWHFEAHGKAFAHQNKYGGSILRSRSFKMLSFGSLVVLTQIIERCLRNFRMPIGCDENTSQEKAFGAPPDMKVLFDKLVGIEDFQEELEILKDILLNDEAEHHA